MLKNAYYFIIMKHKLNIYIVGPRESGKTKVASKIRESLQEFREKFDIEIEESVSLANVPRQVSRSGDQTLNSAPPANGAVGTKSARERVGISWTNPFALFISYLYEPKFFATTNLKYLNQKIANGKWSYWGMKKLSEPGEFLYIFFRPSIIGNRFPKR